jgi:Mg/Co/Ni transporter MgtE
MKRYRYRSATTGRFVSREFAEAHPSVTVRERIRQIEQTAPQAHYTVAAQ